MMITLNRWLPFDEAVLDRTRLATKLPRSAYLSAGRFPVIDQGQEEISGYTDDLSAGYSGALPVVLFGDHTRALKLVERPFAAGADGIKVLEPSSDLNAKFLWYYLRSRPLPNDGYSRHFKHLRELRVPIPAMADQLHAVDLLSRAENIVRMRRDAEKKAKEIIPALFLEMFGDPATNPKGWPTQTFRDIGTLDRGKSRHRPRDAPHLYGGLHPFVQTGDVARSGGVITTYAQTYSDAGLAQSKLWPVGTLCITIAANIAETGILDFEACFPDSVVGFLPGENVRTDYIQNWLHFLKPTLAAQAPQAAQKNINLEILRNLNVPIPPMSLQVVFEEDAKRLRSTEACQLAATTVGDQVFQSLLAGVFSEGMAI